MQTITVQVKQDEDWYVSHCLDYGIASQGRTMQEAKENSIEAVSMFLEVACQDEISRRKAEHGELLQLSLDDS